MTPTLAEALRNEIRLALEAEGKPFDIHVARRVYDLAIAARDFCVAATETVKEAIDQIQDTNGPMDTLAPAGSPEPPVQAAETFGARIFREIMALMPANRQPQITGTESLSLVHAIAAARERGMLDVAASLEQRLLGTPLEPQKIARVEVVDDSYEHGFLEGSMEANFDNGTVDGCVSRDLRHASPAYQAGFAAGRARRPKLEAGIPPAPEPLSLALDGPLPSEVHP